MASKGNPFGASASLPTQAGNVTIYRLAKLQELGLAKLDELPFSIKVLLESCLRNTDNFQVNEQDVTRLAAWKPDATQTFEVPFKVGRVILQDFTGVPCVVDLAAMRAAMKRAGGDPQKINPLVHVDLVIDHSVQVDEFGSESALFLNSQKEFERNRERYEFLKWGQKAFRNFGVVPPATGIVHQVNLEYLASVVMTENGVAFPDSLVGTDSHTTMINGLGVVGWGVGGIEAEACMLGQPIYLVTPQVVGFKLTGKLPEGATATDLVLTITQILRSFGVVEKFVEFFGEGLSTMSVADRATIANMAPEYGATIGFFPVDDQALKYLRLTGRAPGQVDLVERYCKEQGLWRQDKSEPKYTQVLELDLGTVVPSLAGPKRPQDRVELPNVRKSFASAFPLAPGSAGGHAPATGGVAVAEEVELKNADVVIAAITSCTNTSNPSVMLAAGLLAKKAIEKGLKVKPHVKTSLSPGSRVVTDYFEKAGLQKYLDMVGFQTTGYGCMTCIGNSGPLPEHISRQVEEHNLAVAAVLSGNRNFEGRINPHVKANYLASPPLVVAYALAGTVDIDLKSEPIGTGNGGQKVYLRDIWPTQQEVNNAIETCVSPEMFKSQYTNVGDKNEQWNAIPVRGGELFDFDPKSTYIQEPSFFMDLKPNPAPIKPINSARVLVMVGDSVTTDHISPAGSIKKDSPAGKFLMDNGVKPLDFNSYGSRRGNDRVMTRGTFANIRLKNQLAPGTEGGVTKYLPTSEVTSIYDASIRYQQAGTPLIVLAGKDYGMGSSRDWAAKGVFLLGVKAAIAESFERIHRSNLVGMGVLPLVFKKGETRASLGLTGEEIYSIQVDDHLKPGQDVVVKAGDKTFITTCRIDTPVELEYYRNGGILQTVLRKMLKGG
ncbi:MAG TPA: aconitate hydratase AcnA [Tepidisphaeraceae bacterium]|nr:aconitate hydratase AcnA [Tepidisphaeraceae bacterium]